MFGVVWSTDIAAYFTGRLIGGPKLFLRISPKKTWSGFWGGTIAGTLAGLAVAEVGRASGINLPFDRFAVAMLSAAASILGQIGDLAESGLKRHFDVKDSSHLIPGHGGVMDRLDAFWAVCVVVMLGLLLRPLFP
jgi:phosphatidate cytidylyltransferase